VEIVLEITSVPLTVADFGGTPHHESVDLSGRRWFALFLRCPLMLLCRQV
jgi:hypothetical protein